MNDFKIYELTEENVETYINTHGKVNPKNVNKKDRKNLLKTAVVVGDEELVKLCLLCGVDPNDPILLENSAYYGHYEIVKMLLENGADPTSNGGIAFQISKVRCHYEVHNLIKQYLRRYKINKLLNEK